MRLAAGYVLIVKEDLAASCRQNSADYIEKCGFPRAIGADDRGNPAGLDAKIDFIDCNQAAKRFLEFFRAQ